MTYKNHGLKIILLLVKLCTESSSARSHTQLEKI